MKQRVRSPFGDRLWALLKGNGMSVRDLALRFAAKDYVTENVLESYLKASPAAVAPEDDQAVAIIIALGLAPDDPVSLDLLKSARISRAMKRQRSLHLDGAREIEKQLNALANGLGLGSEIGPTLVQAFVASAYAAALARAGEADPFSDASSLSMHCNAEGVFLSNEGLEDVEDVLVLLPSSPTLKWRLNDLAAGTTKRLTRSSCSDRDIDTAFAEFAGTTQKQRYVQAMSDGAPPIAVSRPCLQLPRTWFDLNRFLMSTLAITREPFSLMKSTELVRAKENGAYRTGGLFGPIQPTQLYTEAGFVIEPGPRPGGEPVLMSRVFNRQLWDTDIPMTVRPGLLEALHAQIKDRSDVTAMAVRAKYVEVTTRDGWIANEEKICLGSDLLAPSTQAEVFHGTYFHGLVTNELAAQILETTSREPEEWYSDFGATIFRERGGQLELGNIVDSKMSNHLGASTLLVTTDGRIQLWRQGDGDQSVGLMTPTGSGSCDWDDRTNGSLTATAITGMEREAREEAGLNDRSDVKLDTRILAYYRWARRGGKPEFVGISKVNVDSNELEAESSEVVRPKSKVPFNLDARSRESLILALEDALRGRLGGCSVPLWVGLAVLLERCEEGDAALQSFLWGKSA